MHPSAYLDCPSILLDHPSFLPTSWPGPSNHGMLVLRYHTYMNCPLFICMPFLSCGVSQLDDKVLASFSTSWTSPMAGRAAAYFKTTGLVFELGMVRLVWGYGLSRVQCSFFHCLTEFTGLKHGGVLWRPSTTSCRMVLACQCMLFKWHDAHDTLAPTCPFIHHLNMYTALGCVARLFMY